MENILTYTVAGVDNKKIRDYLRYEIGLSGRMITKAGMEGRIFSNGQVVKLNHRVNTGDEIVINLVREEKQDIEPVYMDLDVAYEDKDIIIINKPPFMVVHPTKSHQKDTLSNGVIKYFIDNGENCIVRLVSRLDMDTSGLVIIAKNQYSHMTLAKDMAENGIDKIYRAVVHGILQDKKGIIDAPIGRESEDSIKRQVMQEGKRAITHYEVIEEYDNNASLVELKLETGRTHQIRVHMDHIGHPIIGDALYGTGEDCDLINRQALHAYKLCLKQPATRETLVINSKLPCDIESLIEKLK
ncbi:23S rRNA pseudouridine1911/1915/1917 synthase [Hathewaya proteolytica DSM 3090]|uniref:Pseudouridine synthase n=1 Tax=Hathewaya proteolytica DSM 3090 TaxID=1121331 RepID=A0A1M6JIJ7_9CLOT|nr:RluA family pseudouridine synthase [Hathewaya proteolytica]SHJ46568.1 23S rRNA pseudouridine1911/1915/1917 synthase [Hathewaya proteolytica DSM 3090]